VFLDDFGELEQIPLDSYRNRVEPFDPRDDGYAERVHSFFVSQGKRRLFIPLTPVFAGPAGGDLASRLNAALGSLPFSIDYLTPPHSIFFPAVLFTAAAALTLVFSGAPLANAFFLPLWAVLSGMGTGGFVLSALLAALSRILREPVREYFTVQRYEDTRPFLHGAWGMAEYWGNVLKSFRGTCILSLVFLAAYTATAIAAALPAATVISAFFFFLGILCLSLWTESSRGGKQGHVRFLPVPIADVSLKPSFFSQIMVPFALASLGFLFLPGVFPGGDFSGNARGEAKWDTRRSINDAMYREHVRFQLSFSLNPLGSGVAASGESVEPLRSYLRYSLGEDGLIGETVVSADYPGDIFFAGGEIPPFPLQGLIEFLDHYIYTVPRMVSPSAENLKGVFRGDLFSVLIALGLCIPLILWDQQGYKKKRKLFIYRDKRIAA
jgi:hypothetical protein